ncbi:glutathione S-transferase family protein [Oceanobacter kriegii]|uniref:glutathione S-transferase family protein n=1 Tax=Oceanobacter kriegii TaxID=64972 RepID=UPI00041E35A7|nr:glutathione S-transferase family protein [Oceanobacter kriegii]
MTDSLKLYGAPFSPYVRAVRLYAAELGIELESSMAPFGEKIEFKSPQHLALNPFGQMPVLFDGDFHLFETASICRYLNGVAGKANAEPQQQALIDQWAGAVASNASRAVMEGLLLELAFPKGENGKPRLDVVVENLPKARAFLAIIEQQLQAQQGKEQGGLATADYSYADSILTPFIDYAASVPDLDGNGKLVSDDSATGQWLHAMRQRSSAWVLTQK